MQLTLPHLRLHLRKVLLSQPKRLARRRKLPKLKLLLLKRSPKHLLPFWSLPPSPSFLLKKEKDEWGIVIFGPTWIIFSNHESCFNVFHCYQRFLWQGFGNELLHGWKIPKTRLLCWQPSMKLICKFCWLSNCSIRFSYCSSWMFFPRCVHQNSLLLYLVMVLMEHGCLNLIKFSIHGLSSTAMVHWSHYISVDFSWSLWDQQTCYAFSQIHYYVFSPLLLCS